MFALFTQLSRLAPQLLCAMFLLALSGHPSTAQAAGPLAHRDTPGQVREVIAPAATVIATRHYQARLALSCFDLNCNGEFPSAGQKRRLNITRISCEMFAQAGSSFHVGRLTLHKPPHSFVAHQFLPVDHSSSNGDAHVLNCAVDMQVVGAGQHMQVFFS